MRDGRVRTPRRTAATRRDTVKMLKISVLAIAGTLTFAACDAGRVIAPGDLPMGRFEGEIRGTLRGLLRGDAVSGSTVAGYHDVIVLTDHQQRIEVTLFNEPDEFFPGRFPIGDAVLANQDVVAYVRDLDTGEWFDSLDGVIDLYEVGGWGIRGTAVFRAESADVPGDVVDVDVAFAADYVGSISFALSPSFSIGDKAAAPGS